MDRCCDVLWFVGGVVRWFGKVLSANGREERESRHVGWLVLVATKEYQAPNVSTQYGRVVF